jgi:hypothetical protein
MEGTLTRRCHRRAADSRRARLEIECLESRLCLTKDFVIPQFAADALPGHVARLTGRVVDFDPSSVELTFSGAVNGTTSPAPDGTFTYETTDARVGMVYVAGINSLNETAGNQDPLLVPRPAITLNIAYGSRNFVTLSGSVSDLDAGDLTVTFKGVAKGSVSTDDFGEFSYTTTASSLGEVKATTVNLWLQRSVPSTVSVVSAPPVIVNFLADKSSDGVWVFSGVVQDEDSAGLVVVFSNHGALNGQSAVVGSDGKFCMTVELRLIKPVQIHADVMDWFGLAADGAWVDIAP